MLHRKWRFFDKLTKKLLLRKHDFKPSVPPFLHFNPKTQLQGLHSMLIMLNFAL